MNKLSTMTLTSNSDKWLQSATVNWWVVILTKSFSTVFKRITLKLLWLLAFLTVWIILVHSLKRFFLVSCQMLPGSQKQERYVNWKMLTLLLLRKQHKYALNKVLINNSFSFCWHFVETFLVHIFKTVGILVFEQ